MFGITGSQVQPLWRRVEEDFQLGTCSRRVFGYLCCDGEGEWTAFNEDAEAVAASTNLKSAREALWSGHQHVHESECELGLSHLHPIQKATAFWRDKALPAMSRGSTPLLLENRSVCTPQKTTDVRNLACG